MTEYKDLYGNDDIEAMYQAALRVPLQDKIQMAIQLIQTFEKQALTFSKDGYYVCFSGGKDSIVMEKLFEMADVKFTLNYSNVTIDPPELVQFIKRQYPQAIWHSQGKPLPLAMVDIGMPPTRIARWCCEKYKEQGGNGQAKGIGVRAAESQRRKGIWKTVNANKRDRGIIICPIVYWTDDDIWQFIRDNNMPYCKLYDEGFKRLGCIGCPMAGKQRHAQFARYPKHKKLWMRGFELMHEKFKGTLTKQGKTRSIEKFATALDNYNHWMEEESVNDTDQPDCQLWLW